MRQSLEFLAAIFRIPFVKFLGISPGGLNATGEADLRNFYDHVGSKQEKILREPLNRVLDILQLHLFGEVDPEIRAVFVPLSEEDGAQRATTLKTEADRDAVYLDKGVLDRAEVRQKLSDTPESGYGFIDAKVLPESGQENGPAGGMSNTVGKPDQEEVMEQAASQIHTSVGKEQNKTLVPAMDAASADWKEADHPRDKDGKFTPGDGTAGGSGEEDTEKDEGKEAEEPIGPNVSEKNKGMIDGLIEAENRIAANKGNTNPLDPATGTLIVGPAAAKNYKAIHKAVDSYTRQPNKNIPIFGSVKTTAQEDINCHKKVWELHQRHETSPEEVAKEIAALSADERLKLLAHYHNNESRTPQQIKDSENNLPFQLLLMGVPSIAASEMKEHIGSLRNLTQEEYYQKFYTILNSLKLDYLPVDLHKETQVLFNKSREYVQKNEKLLTEAYREWQKAKTPEERFHILEKINPHLNATFGVNGGRIEALYNPDNPSAASTPIGSFLRFPDPQWVSTFNLSSPIFSNSNRENFILSISTLPHEMQHQRQAIFMLLNQEQSAGQSYIKSSSVALNAISYIDSIQSQDVYYMLQPIELQAHLLQRSFAKELDKILSH